MATVEIPFERNRFEDPFPCRNCNENKVFTRLHINKKILDSAWLCRNCSEDIIEKNPDWTVGYIPVTIRDGLEN